MIFFFNKKLFFKIQNILYFLKITYKLTICIYMSSVAVDYRGAAAPKKKTKKLNKSKYDKDKDVMKENGTDSVKID